MIGHIIFTVPTTSNRPSVEMVAFIYVCIYMYVFNSPCLLTWPDRYILAQFWHVAPLGPSSDHFRMRFLI